MLKRIFPNFAVFYRTLVLSFKRRPWVCARVCVINVTARIGRKLSKTYSFSLFNFLWKVCRMCGIHPTLVGWARFNVPLDTV